MNDPWVYIQTEAELWTVGFYGPNEKFEPESDHGCPEEAAARVRWLNGARDDAAIAVELRRLAESFSAQERRENVRADRLLRHGKQRKYEGAITTARALHIVVAQLTARAIELDPSDAA